MNEEILKNVENLIPKTYVAQAMQARSSQGTLVKELIEKRKCPKEGWTESTIELLLREISQMDSNNFFHNVGVGEREARIYSGMVARRHFGLGHGIGRSGELMEVQPKAAGSSLIYKLTNAMVLHIIKLSGIQSTSSCVVVPLATGMSLVLCLLTLRKKRTKAKYVLWPRIDQKSCFKSIKAAGYEAVVIENILEGEELRTNIEEIKKQINTLGPESIAAVMTTTSCFAPRGIDKLEEVAKLCEHFDIPHIVNNAYGLQSSKCCHHIQQAARVGRVDAFVQSTDKNFMVPVGGAVIAGFDQDFIQDLSKTYPGRASGSPILDLFITLLSMGTEGYMSLLNSRKKLKLYLDKELRSVAETYGLKVLSTKNNPISVALTLPKEADENATHVGAMLFLRGVSGTRVLDAKDTKAIDGHVFTAWGTHTSQPGPPYLTAAASVGMTTADVDVFVKRLRKCLDKVTSRVSPVDLATQEKEEEEREGGDGHDSPTERDSERS